MATSPQVSGVNIKIVKILQKEREIKNSRTKIKLHIFDVQA